MTTSDARGTTFAPGEADSPLYFGEWLKRRRHKLDLTQEQLAKRANCSVFAIRKIELGERRPSKQLAGLLVQALEIPPEDQAAFIKAARGELSVERLASPARVSQPAARSGAVPGNGNLPRTLTPFIGREPELSALGRLLRDPQCSLLTITGPGGIGKTRLAIEVGHHSKELFPDGVWFVPLAPLHSPALLVPAIADALNVPFRDPANPKAALLRYLREKRALLILDNAEHLLDGVGLFTEILQDCPGVKLLVTSRERLALLSEWVFEILGLPAPASDRVEQFESYSSVALFLQSARRTQSGFALKKDERRWVRDICQATEGLPLGIELAAAWVGLLSCEEIAKEIRGNLDFLSVSMRDLPERHRSLRATLDHSWKLLTADEKLTLRRLAVFSGGFRWEAAREICGASLAGLASLRNKTLLQRTDRDDYGLHEIIRQYAGLKLAEDPGEQVRIKDRHARYYVQRLAEWEKALRSERQMEIFHEMARMIENLSQGWQHMVAQGLTRAGKSSQFRGDVFHSSLRSLSLFYETRCRNGEAVAIFTQMIAYLQSIQAVFENTEDYACFCAALGHITAYLGWHQGWMNENEQAREHLEEAIRLLNAGNSRVERAQAQFMLAEIAKAQGREQESAGLFEQCREVFREEREDWWYLASLIYLARIYIPLGKLKESEALFQEAVPLLKPGDMHLELPLKMGLANVSAVQGDFARSEQLMLDSLKLGYQYENNRVIAACCVALGRIMLATQRIEAAETYLQEGINRLSEFGEPDNLALALEYIGKCYVARKDLRAAGEKFRHMIRIGLALHTFWPVYVGLANIARLYMAEGKTEQALEIALVLRDCPVENKNTQAEGDSLLADLRASLPAGQLEAALQQAESKRSTGQARAYALADELIKR